MFNRNKVGDLILVLSFFHLWCRKKNVVRYMSSIWLAFCLISSSPSSIIHQTSNFWEIHRFDNSDMELNMLKRSIIIFICFLLAPPWSLRICNSQRELYDGQHLLPACHRIRAQIHSVKGHFALKEEGEENFWCMW